MPPTHLTDAESLLSKLKPLHNRYDADDKPNSTIDWQRGRAYTNCATFITQLLKHSYGLSDAEFRRRWKSASPSAAVYHDAIVGQQHFTRIERIEAILPGDIITIRYPQGSPSSGHVMLVAAAPQHRPDSRPIVVDANQWDVSVIDSTRSPHGTTDTRKEGIGRGTIRLYASRGGEILGHTWSPSSAHYYGQSARPLAVGRLKA